MIHMQPLSRIVEFAQGSHAKIEPFNTQTDAYENWSVSRQKYSANEEMDLCMSSDPVQP